jgi:hypothetical protein
MLKIIRINSISNTKVSYSSTKAKKLKWRTIWKFQKVLIQKKYDN